MCEDANQLTVIVVDVDECHSAPYGTGLLYVHRVTSGSVDGGVKIESFRWFVNIIVPKVDGDRLFHLVHRSGGRECDLDDIVAEVLLSVRLNCQYEKKSKFRIVKLNIIA